MLQLTGNDDIYIVGNYHDNVLKLTTNREEKLCQLKDSRDVLW